jgi:hypothetical protein
MDLVRALAATRDTVRQWQYQPTLLNGQPVEVVTTIGGQAAPPLDIVFHVLDGGKTILGMSVDAGATMSCTLRLMRYAGY